MGADEQKKQPNETPPAETDQALDPEEAKRQAYRKKKPVGPIMKPLSKEELDDLVNDPEIRERDHLADALPKGTAVDDQDEF
jgi:hypothetical protein